MLYSTTTSRSTSTHSCSLTAIPVAGDRTFDLLGRRLPEACEAQEICRASLQNCRRQSTASAEPYDATDGSIKRDGKWGPEPIYAINEACLSGMR
jgi:hypothetical protein